jgi:hypothetical protein
MYQPYTTDLARQHRNQLMREADAYRITKGTRAAMVAQRKATFHRIVVSAVSLLAWPVRH